MLIYTRNVYLSVTVPCTGLQLEMSEMTIFNACCWQVKFKKSVTLHYITLSSVKLRYVTLFLVTDDHLVGIWIPLYLKHNISLAVDWLASHSSLLFLHL